MAGTKDYVYSNDALVAQTVLVADSDLGNSLEGIDISGMPDRSVCYVNDVGGTFRWFDDSTSTPVAGSVILPTQLTVSDAGRWILEATSTITSGTVPAGTFLTETRLDYDSAPIVTGNEILSFSFDLSEVEGLTITDPGGEYLVRCKVLVNQGLNDTYYYSEEVVFKIRAATDPYVLFDTQSPVTGGASVTVSGSISGTATLVVEAALVGWTGALAEGWCQAEIIAVQAGA